MAARLNPRHQTAVREKIKASQIINALQNHIFGKHKLDASQVTAGLGLLKKCVPDLTSVELSGEVDVKTRASDLSDDELAKIANASRKHKS